jgi:hypothetical protein
VADNEVHLTTKEPKRPPDAEFGIKIDFKRGEGSPERIFQAAEAMIRALRQLDHALCGAVDNNIQTVMVLENIEIASLTVWLRNLLQRTDDDALKQLEWKPLIGRYLVKAKYVYIDWANKSDSERSLLGLAKNLRELAKETDIRRFPDYAPPSVVELADSARQIQAAKSYLIEGDKISYVVPDQPPAEFDMAVTWNEEELSKLLIRETVTATDMPMTLIVKKPDYLGKSKWEFRFGRRAIPANIEDQVWLSDFQTRKIDVRPGDALKCLVNIEHHYGHDNELISDTVVVVQVLEVLENQLRQSEMDLDSAKPD